MVADFGQEKFGIQTDGALGLDVLNLLDIDLDMLSRTIRLYHPEHDCSHPSAVMHGPFYQTDLITHTLQIGEIKQILALAARRKSVPAATAWPRIVVTIGGHPVEAIVDRGAPNTYIYSLGARMIGVTQAEFDAYRHIRTGGVGPKAVEAAIHIVPSMDIGDLEVRNVPFVLINEPAEVVSPEIILGADILRHIHMWISHSSHTLIMQFPPTPSPASPPPPPTALSPHIPPISS